MYRNAWVRIAIVTAFAWAAAHSPPGFGFPFLLDGWLWLGVRDWTWLPPRRLPLIVAGAMIAADVLGAALPRAAVRVERPGRWAAAIGAAAAAAFWLLRVRVWYGDLPGVDLEPPPWWTIETAEPLGAFTFYHTVHGARALGVNASSALAFVSAISGGLAMAALFLWARAVSPEWPLLLAMVALSGSSVLFCGYPEKGTPKALALVCCYLYFGTRAIPEQRAWLNAAASLTLALAAAMHGSALCWLPAHALCVWRRAPRRHALLGVAAFLLPFLLLGAYVAAGAPVAGGRWGNVAAPRQWIKKYCITNCGYDFWSSAHGWDVLNSLLALSPAAVLSLPEALWRSRQPTSRWLALGAAGGLFLSAVWFPVFGYRADWDIFAATPLALSAYATYVAATTMPERQFRRFSLLWIAGTGLHAASWWRAFQRA